MLDAEIAATDAGTLARFAERVREFDRAPAGTSADRVRRLFARADLVRSWPTVRAALVAPPPTADATLAERSRQLAERCRTSKGGWLGQWPTELLSEAAERLSQLADRLDASHTPTGIVAQLTAVLAGWSADSPTSALVHLDKMLATTSDTGGDLLADLNSSPLGHAFAAFDTKLNGWPDDARAVAGALCAVVDRLTQQTSDVAVWEKVRRWAGAWFADAAVLAFVEHDLPTWAGVVERFPLAGERRVYLAVAGQADDTAQRDDGAPVVGSIDSTVNWPTATSRIADQPFDTIVDVRPDGGVTLSDSPVSAAFAAFHELFDATRDEHTWWAGGRWRRARQLCRTLDPAAVAWLAAQWIDECSPTDTQAELVCRWAAACGLTVTRADSPDTPGVTVRHVFASAPAGAVVGHQIGFSSADEVFRPAVVDVSAGPLPVGFTDLERAGEALPKGNELRKRVAGLRGAAEGDYLREAVLGLYSDFWGDAGSVARDADPDATAEVGDRLNALLADAYALRPFFPTTVHDLPSGWVTVAAGSRVMTGVVTRVLRPGLQDDHGHLRIPAVVEVE